MSRSIAGVSLTTGFSQSSSIEGNSPEITLRLPLPSWEWGWAGARLKQQVIPGLVLSLFCLMCLTPSSAMGEEYFDQPVVTVVSSGGQQLIDTVKRIATLSKQPQIESFLQGRLNQLPILSAFNLDRPVAGLLFFPKAGIKVEVVVLLAVKDFNAIREALVQEYQVRVQATEAPDYWKVDGKKRVFHLRVHNEYVAVSESVDLLKHLSEQHLDQVQQQAELYDLSATCRPQAMPKALRDIAVLKMTENLKREIKRNPEQSDAENEVHSQLGELVITALTQLMQETERVATGIRLNETIEIHSQWTALPESDLMRNLQKLNYDRNAFVEHDDSAFHLSLSLMVNEPLQEIFLKVLAIVRRQVAKNVGGHLKSEDRHPGGQVFETLTATIKRGALNSCIEFRPAGEHLALISGISLENSQGLATTLQTILPYLAGEGDVAEVTLNVIDSKNLQVHRLIGKETKQEDRETYGDDVALYVGTDHHAGWFSIGNPQTLKLLKQHSIEEALPSSYLVKANWSFFSWVQLAARNNHQDEMLQFLQAAFPTSDEDDIHLLLTQADRSITFKGSIDSGYQRLAGIILGELLSRRGE